MAFGFPPKFVQEIDLNGSDAKHYLAIAIETIKQLGWNLDFTGKSGLVAYIGGGLKSKEEFLVDIQGETVTLTSHSTAGMFDLGRNKKHVDLFVSTFQSVRSSLTASQLEEKTQQLQPVFDAPDVPVVVAPVKTFKDGLKSFGSLFIPRDGYFITPIIIDINFLVFIIMVVSGVNFFEPSVTDIMNWGANLRGVTLQGQPWRLVTNIFLHYGIAHITFNMYALVYIGILLEPYLGKLRFAAAYLFTGILASLSSIAWHVNTASAGASGAIFGMYGVFMAMLTTNFIDKNHRKSLLISIGLFILFNLVYGAAGGIDNAAHIGGLLSGMVIGYCYYPSLERPASPKFKYVTVALLTVVVLFCSATIYHSIPDDLAKYDADLRDFSKDEDIALGVYHLPKTATKADTLYALKQNGIPYWNKNLKMLDAVDKLNLPDNLKHRDSLLRQYCNLRIITYNYKIKDADENSYRYVDSINLCLKKIHVIIDSLKTNNK